MSALLTMTVFAIILDHESTEAWVKVRTNWPDNHLIADDRLAFVSTEKSTLTNDVSEKIGIGKEAGISGIVIQMDYYAGATYMTTVEWVGKNRG